MVNMETDAHGVDDITREIESTSPDDDVWGSDSDTPDISQTTKVRRDHYNSGYLDGITQTKEQQLQNGFDEGYPIGAAIGLQVGRILGALQGSGLTDLEKAAAKELSPDHIFAQEFWDEKANPKWAGDFHPLVFKWIERVEQFTGIQLC
jgi:hypothetical protein